MAVERQTLVFYMGIASSGMISQRLIQHGLSASTPVAIIERGTQPEQRVMTSVLGTLAMMIELHAVETPTLLIIGDVVTLYREANTFYNETNALRSAITPRCSVG
ncbi:hypothetical protein BS639_08305 [Rouxiella silvae]|uniref:Tetrapyrrole methylase domain-containing protein n=1 Tax=Rouxiella silvae TaxID=1646373 RepID=A0ABX3U3F9_9GAMM|nr:hypothetical protein [Rouxiella silvae]ORJ21784.1 hypothetical protein BS639_08305 [Rouxiella silvae]